MQFPYVPAKALDHNGGLAVNCAINVLPLGRTAPALVVGIHDVILRAQLKMIVDSSCLPCCLSVRVHRFTDDDRGTSLTLVLPGGGIGAHAVRIMPGFVRD